MRLCPAVVLALLLAVPSIGHAGEELLKPTKAHHAMSVALRRVPHRQRDAEKRRRSIEYLKRWEASGRKPTPTDRYALGQFLEAAGRLKEAAEHFRTVETDPGCSEKAQDYAASAECGLLCREELRKEIGDSAVEDGAKRLDDYARKMAGDPGRMRTRVTLLSNLAYLEDILGHGSTGVDLRLEIVRADHSKISSNVRPIAYGLLACAWTMDAYGPLRKRAAAAFKEMHDIQAGEVATAAKRLDSMREQLRGAQPDALDAQGHLVKTDPKEMSRGERSVLSAQRSRDNAQELLTRVDAYAPLFDLLGKKAPDWTLEHAFGDVKSLSDVAGKVVVLDFFATWADLCNFPLMRDLARDFGPKGLQVVGVTTTGPVVYASRYDIDEDLKSKDTGGGLRYYARLATEDSPADANKAVFGETEYRTHEIEALEAFKKNHGLSWPIVLVQKDDPAKKYGMEGLPYLLVLDKQGRIRFLRSGALPRSSAGAFAAVRKVVQDLLAE